ncbi:hypothetical protein JOD54_006375 [Actinokineospora baliensis]|uniref:hypothetical protein n=1 Tax=Actinokineospora baliensis TaxID=547056 RepID=UPI001956D614|nr:hypothetical protein [Actinokineospora baliensis]MBM7776171.1 hypothetical protein [Actinokineospora baliensis]
MGRPGGRGASPTLLVAVGAIAEFGPLRDVVHPVEIAPDVTVRWSAVGGAPAVEQVLRAAGVPSVPWSRTEGFDLVLARHTTGEIAGLVVTVTDADDIPVAVGVSVAADRAAAEATIPGAVGRTFVMGDPTWSRVLAVAHRRAEFRAFLDVPERARLVGVACARPDVAARVLSRLPFDEFRVVSLVPGAATDFGGLIALSPDSDWTAALIACDIVVGDPGPLTGYAAALGRAVLPDNAVDVDFLTAARATSSTSDIPRALPAPAHLLRDKVYDLLGLDPPVLSAAQRPFGPLTLNTHPATAFAVSTTLELGAITVTRFPFPPSRRAGEDLLLIDDAEPDPTLRANAEIITRPHTEDAPTWLAQTIRQSHCALAATTTSTTPDSHFTWYTGEHWTANLPDNLPLPTAAAAVYHHLVEHDPITTNTTIPIRLADRVERLILHPVT